MWIYVNLWHNDSNYVCLHVRDGPSINLQVPEPPLLRVPEIPRQRHLARRFSGNRFTFVAFQLKIVESLVLACIFRPPDIVVVGLRFTADSIHHFSSATLRARWTGLNQNRPRGRKWVRFENACPKSGVSHPPANRYGYYGSLLPWFTAYCVAKFGWVLSAEVRV